MEVSWNILCGNSVGQAWARGGGSRSILVTAVEARLFEITPGKKAKLPDQVKSGFGRPKSGPFPIIRNCKTRLRLLLVGGYTT